MIEMSVDKETVLANERPPPPPGQHPELYEQCTEDPLQPLGHKAKPDGGLNLGEGGAEENGNHKTSHQTLDSSIQSLNYVQQSKSQPRLKRRSTMNSGFKHPIFGKRRRRANSESESVLPTNFLLGGNIFDPLNLNSLLDEEVNRALNAETPKSSPLPAKSRDPVEILIPRDITDPLNLNCCTAGDSTGGLLLTPLKTAGGGRRRHRNRHHGVGGSGRGGEGPVTQLYLSLPESEKARTFPELTLASSGSHLDSVETSETSTEEVVETKIESKLESNDIPTQESQTQCPSDPNLTTSREEMDEMPSVVENAATSTNVPHRHRKRKRTTSKSENSAAPNCEKAKATASGNQPQPNHPQGIVPQTQPPQQPNHRRHQKIQQNPNQHQQQNKNHHQHQQQKKKFQYGNYDKYYGYRNPGSTEDPRLWTLKPEWFKGKEVLDLGCNTGRLTLTIAKNWRPSRIVGLDIDGALIHAARQNIRYYLSEMHVLRARSRRVDDSGGKETKGDEGKEADHQELAGRKESDATVERAERPGVSSEVQEERKKDRGDEERESIEEKMDGSADVKETSREPESEGREDRARKGKEGEEKEEVKADAVQAVSSSSSENYSFPISLRISRGPIAAPPLPDTNTPPPGNFPSNVTFVKGNYVLESDVLLLTQREEYDVVLCLSVTKWVHLNWGDVGLKRFFQRVYRHLRPGGLFILEPQPWHSYGKRKKLTETITKNYYSIRLKPEQFSSYLMSDEVGFSSYELIGTPTNLSRGFQRPIYLFHKGPTPQK